MSTEVRELLHNLLGDLMLVHELTTHERLKRVWRSGRIEYSKCWTKKTNAPVMSGFFFYLAFSAIEATKPLA
jgi:hypothetical protein